MSNYESKKLTLYKPQGYLVTPEVLKKIKTECPSEFIFYIYKDVKENMWYCSVNNAVSINAHQYLFSADTESIVVFGDAFYPNATSPVSFRPQQEEEEWIMAAGIGKHTFMTASDNSRLFFDNFLAFLDSKGVNKMLKKVCEACPGVSYAVVTKNGPKLIGADWEEKDGVFYSSTAFFNKLSYGQKTFAKNVLAFLSKNDIVAEQRRLDVLTDAQLIKESKANKDLWEKICLM